MWLASWRQLILRALGCADNTVSIAFTNSNDDPIYIQVDPWAGWYALKKGDQIHIIAVESENRSPQFDIQEYGASRILTLCNSDEYFVVIDGKRIHFSNYLTDPRVCRKCFKLPISGAVSGEICKCDL